jgi:hypothetical protein
MAARTMRVRHQDDIRAKIRASQLVNRLEDHVFGDAELSATQVTAALGLLKKCVSDLASTEVTGKDGGPLDFRTIERRIVDPPH